MLDSFGSPRKSSPFGTLAGTSAGQGVYALPGSSRKGKRRTYNEDDWEGDGLEEEDKIDEDTAMDVDGQDDDAPCAVRQPVFSSGGSGTGRTLRGLPNRGAKPGSGASLGRTTSLPADVFSDVHGF